MNYEQVEAFVAVVDYKSMTMAAANLFITQPTLTHRIQMLENDLGYPLLVRKKGVRETELSEAGMRFLPMAVKLLDLWAEAKDLVNLHTSNVMHISYMPSLKGIVPDIFDRFISRGLPTALSLVTYYCSLAYQMVERGNLDMALVSESKYAKNIIVTPLFTEKFFLVCSDPSAFSEHPSPDELDVSTEISSEWTRDFRAWHDHWFGASARPMVFTDSEALTARLLSHRGSWAVTAAVTASNRANKPGLHLIEMSSPPPDRTVYMITRQNTIFPPAMEALIEDTISVLNETEHINLIYRGNGNNHPPA